MKADVGKSKHKKYANIQEVNIGPKIKQTTSYKYSSLYLAVGCTNKTNKCGEVKFYRIPSEPDWTTNEHTKICSEHFVTGKWF